MEGSASSPARARESRSRALSIFLSATAAAAPILYPLWLWLSSGRVPARLAPSPVDWPGLTVLVAAYREREVIAAKLADARDNGYPGALELLVVAEDRDTAQAAREAGAQVIEPEQRVGKSEAINLGLAAATQPVVAITDADTRLERGSLVALVRWLDDPGVGLVAGEKRETSGGQGLYWRFESWVKRWESRRGATIGVVGELAALRRSSFSAIPRDVAVDDLWIGLDMIESGQAVVYEPDAVAVEKPSPSLSAEWERRTRTNAGLIDLLWRRRHLLAPGRSRVAAELWGHKVMRSVFGPLAHAALLAQALLRAPRSRIAAAFAAAHLYGAAGLAAESRGRPTRGPQQAIAQVIFLQATALGGLLRYLRGDRPALWPKGERRAESGEVFSPPADSPGNAAQGS